MKFVAKNRRAEIKESSRDTYKVYKATVELENEVDPSHTRFIEINENY